MAQIIDELLKERLQQVVLTGYLTFKLSHNKKGFSLNSSIEIFDSDHQVASNVILYPFERSRQNHLETSADL